VVPTNARALARMSDDPDLKAFMWRPADQQRTFRMNWKVVEPQMPSIVDRWNRTVTR
jgi:hypothetical protein